PNHATYIEQFDGYINGSVKDNFASQISEADGVQLIRTPTDRNPNGDGNANVVAVPFRLGGTVTSTDTNYGDGFAFVKYINSGDKSVGLLRGTNLGTAVVDTTPTAIWSGRLVVHYDKAVADTKNSQLDLRVNFAESTIETIAPITIVAYEANAVLADSVHKQSLEIKGIFGSHVDAFGLRTGTLGGTVEYTVGHYYPDGLRGLSGSTLTLATAHRRVTARLPLRGLIGEDGAIGVFHGVLADDAFDNVHLVGGFEVSPRAAITTTTASFGRWARGATECEAIKIRVSAIDFDTECATTKAIIFAHPNDLFLSDEDFSGSATKRQGFVLGSTNGIDLTSALSPLPAPVVRTLTLGDDVIVNNVGERFILSGAMGDATDGVAFVSDTLENSMYTGLLSGTDLGAPLTTSSALQTSWPGRLVYLINGSPINGGDFTLTVNFADMRISGDVVAAGGFALEGSYDEYGVITGIIKGKLATTLAGSVSGLIGVEGAVGAFVINTSDPLRVGGFVAAPVAKITATSYAHFADYYEDSERVAE
nr:hypothetical protein [Pseudomonadota bacterium]